MMKRLLPVLLFGAPLLLNAQGSWTQLNDMSGPSRSWASAFSVDGKGYVTAGVTTDGETLGDLWEFDPETDSWTQKDSMPLARFRGVAMSVGDKGYVGMGTTDQPASSDWWQYDPVMDQWVAKLTLPAEGRVDAVGFAIMEKCYVGGGLSENGTALLDLHEFDPDLNSWTQKGNIPMENLSAAASFVIDGLAYVVAGRTTVPDEFTNEVYSYDPVTDEWTPRAPFPGDPRLFPVAFTVEGIGYVGTGTAVGLTSDWYAYDPENDMWEMMSDFPGEPRTKAVAFSIGHHGYVSTGSTGEDTDQNDTWVFLSPNLTSVDDRWAGSDVQIYPNPSNGQLRIRSTEGSGVMMLTLLDVLGQEVWKKDMAWTDDQVIDLSSVPGGTYFLRYQDDQKDHTSILVMEK